MDWISIKGYVNLLAVSKDALHIYVAIFIQVVVALIARRSLGSLLPWTAVLLLELLNEALDLLFEKEPYIHRWQIDGAIHDLINTLLLPTILMLLVRFVPSLFRAPRPSSEKLEFTTEVD
jgi:hypothetical protein